MAQLWCINCQAERDYPCSCVVGSCNHSCPTCEKNTLASIQPNAGDTGYSLIKQMVGEAQRIAQSTGRTGNIEVSRTIGNASGEYQTQILVYNTYTRQHHFNKS